MTQAPEPGRLLMPRVHLLVETSHCVSLWDLPDSDWESFFYWSEATIPGALDIDAEERARIQADMRDYFLTVITERRSEPRDDLISVLVAEDLNDDELKMLARVFVWLAQTTTGDRAELSLPTGRDRAIWNRLATEVGACSADQCENGQGGRCFFYRNRRAAATT